MKAAADAGIPVIVIDSGEDQVEKLGLKLYVGTTSYFEQGMRAAKQLMAAGVTKGVCANHEAGNLVNRIGLRRVPQGHGRERRPRRNQPRSHGHGPAASRRI